VAKLDTLIPISDSTRNSASVLRQIKESLKSEAMEAERAILTRLAQGEREIARGEGYDLDHVLNEADSLLRRPPR
jgi:predicted transcriptional regulator